MFIIVFTLDVMYFGWRDKCNKEANNNGGCSSQCCSCGGNIVFIVV